MVQTYDLPQAVVIEIFNQAGISYSINDTEFKIFPFHVSTAQRALTTYFVSQKPKVLLPVQFYFLLAKCGLDQVLNPLLEAVKSVDNEKYAMYKAYLNGARYYEFSKAIGLYTELKDKILALNPELDFSEEQLKVLWSEAGQV
ncbi:hypothetical protein [Acinetobacter colistiniresistens]|uniref:hypothetical protein n=1 Tax=Acinetobacter colistiniresistens TaxID=280145 RepID=UPI00124FF581|nr:hypothetical protein [Acinetobacter colistiniresistens]